MAPSPISLLPFGTGGIRAIVGRGARHCNSHTMGAIAQGLANYLAKGEGRVLLSYDSRNSSRSFAEEMGRILAGNGIETLLTEEPRPTPFVSFGCRHYRCTAAIMITGSHNSPEYNGCKIYWSDGAQVTHPHDQKIAEEIQKIRSPLQIKRQASPSMRKVGREGDEAYFRALGPLQNFPEDNRKLGERVHLIYSPLHGTGITTLPEGLKRWGFASISYVESQKRLDGDFPTTSFPNPEMREALALGIEQLVEEDGDLFLATDPDGDRIGVAAMHEGHPVILNGNQIASLCAYYLCSTLKKLGKLPNRAIFATTIVTTPLFEKIITAFEKKCAKVPTGFKYIGKAISKWEGERDCSFIFAAEESCGYLYGTHARDKDGTAAACLIMEIALQQKKRGKTLVDLLYDIYREFGLFKEKSSSIAFAPGNEGAEQMKRCMQSLRNATPKAIGGKAIIAFRDYAREGDQVSMPSFPRTDLLSYTLRDHTHLLIRPSGTEPKVKIYCMTSAPMAKAIDEGLADCDRRLDHYIASVKEWCASFDL